MNHQHTWMTWHWGPQPKDTSAATPARVVTKMTEHTVCATCGERKKHASE